MSVQQNFFTVSTLDPAALQRAKTAVERLRWLYIREWAPDALNEMEAAILAMQDCGGDPCHQTDPRDALLRLCHDMKGQAGTFGLDLLTDFAASMHAVVSAAVMMGQRQSDVCLGHIMAMRTALRAASCEPAGLLDPKLERQLRSDLRRIVRKTFN